MRVAILTVSDAGSRGERADGSGDAIVAWAAARGDQVTDRRLVPDETARITDWTRSRSLRHPEPPFRFTTFLTG
ncbi:MAG: MogA/MoaB family molybdenum cofactor biosynthesis protein, partial [Gemmatimonadaceae bacterium]|nr:MogA/MoaB family molybdenum cofactor biosynthesis protein [Gemmatimonadaceae bacterium]